MTPNTLAFSIQPFVASRKSDSIGGGGDCIGKSILATYIFLLNSIIAFLYKYIILFSLKVSVTAKDPTFPEDIY